MKTGALINYIRVSLTLSLFGLLAIACKAPPPAQQAAKSDDAAGMHPSFLIAWSPQFKIITPSQFSALTIPSLKGTKLPKSSSSTSLALATQQVRQFAIPAGATPTYSTSGSGAVVGYRVSQGSDMMYYNFNQSGSATLSAKATSVGSVPGTIGNVGGDAIYASNGKLYGYVNSAVDDKGNAYGATSTFMNDGTGRMRTDYLDASGKLKMTAISNPDGTKDFFTPSGDIYASYNNKTGAWTDTTKGWNNQSKVNPVTANSPAASPIPENQRITQDAVGNKYEYDANGNLSKVTDPNGKDISDTSKVLQDSSGRITQDASGNKYTYDQHGNVKQVFDPNEKDISDSSKIIVGNQSVQPAGGGSGGDNADNVQLWRDQARDAARGQGITNGTFISDGDGKRYVDSNGNVLATFDQSKDYSQADPTILNGGTKPVDPPATTDPVEDSGIAPGSNIPVENPTNGGASEDCPTYPEC